MTPVVADITEPIPLVPSDSRYPTSVLLTPVFVDGGARRRRLIVRGRYLATAACLAYLVMLGVTVTASPVSRPGNTTRPTSGVTGANAPTTPPPRAARLAPRAAPQVSAPKADVDEDAAQDAPLVLRLAAPVPTRPALPKPPGTTQAAATPRPHRDNDSPRTTHSATPVSSSPATAPTPKRAAGVG